MLIHKVIFQNNNYLKVSIKEIRVRRLKIHLNMINKSNLDKRYVSNIIFKNVLNHY